MKLLEVIVTCADEAKQAEQGGADRLEVVRDLPQEGLTPAMETVEEIVAAVSIPVRVMLRETPDFSIKGAEALNLLASKASRFSELPIAGFVLGFLRGDAIDACGVQHMLHATGAYPVTFHRAIEQISDQAAAIEQLKSFPTIDRVLVNGGAGSWCEKRTTLEGLQRQSAPEIRIVTGGGLDKEALRLLIQSPLLNEFHVGRAARRGDGKVDSARVAALRQILDA